MPRGARANEGGNHFRRLASSLPPASGLSGTFRRVFSEYGRRQLRGIMHRAGGASRRYAEAFISGLAKGSHYGVASGKSISEHTDLVIKKMGVGRTTKTTRNWISRDLWAPVVQ